MTQMITFNNLRPNEELAKKLAPEFTKVMISGQYIGGEEVEKFEGEFADYIGSEHCIAVGNGFDALQIALKACEIGTGNLVAATNAPIPTWAAVYNARANIFPVDPDDDYLIKHEIHRNVDVTIPVHLYGNPIDKEEIEKMMLDSVVIEDAAQAVGSSTHGSKAGSIGHMGCFSFYPTKNLGCYGDGGAIVTNDAALAKEARLLRRYGKPGAINSCLDPLQAAFLRVRLQTLDEENQRRADMATLYRMNLEDCEQVTLPPYYYHKVYNYHQFVIRALGRDELQRWLKVNHIETMVHYRDLPETMFGYPSISVMAKYFSKRVLSLPIANVSMKDVVYISEKIKEFYDAKSA
jgi:dTDP-4-amino-4,6-dideoxygalactose transaminase